MILFLRMKRIASVWYVHSFREPTTLDTCFLQVQLFYCRYFWHTVDQDKVPTLKEIPSFSQKDSHLLNSVK